MRAFLWGGAGIAMLFAAAFGAQAAGTDEEDQTPAYPTTEFADGATSAAVTVGDVTAGISMVRRPEIDKEFDVPLLSVMVGQNKVLEVPGVASGMDFPAADASIADIDPDNSGPEVYFTSFSGGAHCCSNVVVGEQVGDKWVAVDIGDFDGDGNFLTDADGDGYAEIATVDNRFLYQFDCYACSVAPLVIMTVRGGKAIDVTTEQRFQGAHRDWLKRIEEDVEPSERWTSQGFLAGWVATKARVGEFDDAWKQLTAHWDSAKDEGEEVCTTGGEPEDCARKNIAVLKFPDRLKLFLQQSGYIP